KAAAQQQQAPLRDERTAKLRARRCTHGRHERSIGEHHRPEVLVTEALPAWGLVAAKVASAVHYCVLVVLAQRHHSEPGVSAACVSTAHEMREISYPWVLSNRSSVKCSGSVTWCSTAYTCTTAASSSHWKCCSLKSSPTLNGDATRTAPRARS